MQGFYMTKAQQNAPTEPHCRYSDCQDISVLLPRDFELESGERLQRPELRVRLYGDRAQPLVAALGGISSGRKVADAGDGRGWWRDIVGAGQSIDLNQFCVLGFDFLPNSQETARTITTLDQAKALAIALQVLELKKLRCFVGASYGGMVALAFAAQYPDLVEQLCVISAADRAHPAATAVRGIQRRILNFAVESGNPEVGVALARQLAMTTYRTPDEFSERFNGTPGAAAGDAYDVCEYLIARGAAFDMDAARYLTLSDSIDRHHVAPENIRSDTTLISSLSDQLVPPADLRRLASIVPALVALHEIQSHFGHDAFLKEAKTIGPLIKSCIRENNT